MFIADYKKHNIFVIEAGSAVPREYFRSDAFNQPNDMTIAKDGTIYASDPHWKRRDGQIWKISRTADGKVQGEPMTSPRALSTTNGIDLSPDEKTLYVGEFEHPGNLGLSHRRLEARVAAPRQEIPRP